MSKMARALVLAAAIGGLSACTSVDRDRAVVGGAAGAVVGGVTTGTLEGAAIGAAIGASAGVLIGRVADGSPYCRYRNRAGRIYVALCR